MALIRAAERSDMAVSTSMSYLFRYSGQLIGVALSNALLQEVLAKQLVRRITGPGANEVLRAHISLDSLYSDVSLRLSNEYEKIPPVYRILTRSLKRPLLPPTLQPLQRFICSSQ